MTWTTETGFCIPEVVDVISAETDERTKSHPFPVILLNLNNAENGVQTQSFEQEFKSYNEALRVSCIKGLPIRVVRSHKVQCIEIAHVLR